MKRDKTLGDSSAYYYVQKKYTEESELVSNEAEKKLKGFIKEKIMSFIFPEELFRVISKYPRIIRTSTCISYTLGDTEHAIYFDDGYCFPILKIEGQKRWDDKLYISKFLDKVPKEYVVLLQELMIEARELKEEYQKKRNELMKLKNTGLKEIELLNPEIYSLVEEYYSKREEELINYLKKQEEQIKETIN